MLLFAHGRGHVLLLVVELIVAGLGTANQLGQRVLLLTNKYIFEYLICFLKIKITCIWLSLYDIMLLSLLASIYLIITCLFKHTVISKLH